jgi:hypothetical protein
LSHVLYIHPIRLRLRASLQRLSAEAVGVDDGAVVGFEVGVGVEDRLVHVAVAGAFQRLQRRHILAVWVGRSPAMAIAPPRMRG